MEQVVHFWESIEPYLYQLLVGTVAVLALLKDWKDYGKLSKKYGKLVPLGLSLVTIVIILLSVQETHSVAGYMLSVTPSALSWTGFPCP